MLESFQDIYLYSYGIIAFDRELYRVIVWKGVAIEKFELNLRGVKRICVKEGGEEVYACDCDTIYGAEFKGRKSFFWKMYCFGFARGGIDELKSVGERLFIWNKE